MQFMCTHACRSPQGVKTDEAAALLVPIRLHMDIDPYKIREQFVWNANDSITSV